MPSIPSPANLPEKGAWDTHWESLEEKRGIFGAISRFVRWAIFQPAVRHYTEKFFPRQGLFVEMGCGTAESSATIIPYQRTLVGLDFSTVALLKARSLRSLPFLTSGDLYSLPFRDASITGLWNLGVMEHFHRPDLVKIFREFHRVLKPGGVMILFWPTEHNSSRWVLGPIEAVKSRITGVTYHFFPDEVSRIRSRKATDALLQETGFESLTMDFSLRTCLIQMVVVARKK